MTPELAPVGHFVQIGQAVEQAIVDHEQRLHMPPPQRGPLQAIPFASYVIPDCLAARAVEMLETGASIYDVAECISVPVSALERTLADWQPRWRAFLRHRSGL